MDDEVSQESGAMAFRLLVKQAFLKYRRGDAIEDPETVEFALREYPAFVIKVAI